jgi:chitinase
LKVDYEPQALPADSLTHVIFDLEASVDPNTGDVTCNLSDFETNVIQLLSLKKAHRTIKTLLSINSATSPMGFSSGVSTPERRRKFASTAVGILNSLGFDGDPRYP